MKKGLYILATLALTLCACKKKTTESVTVIHDCMGHYLRFDNKDHPVCNVDIIANYATGTVLRATFVRAGNRKCDDKNATHCTGVHQFATDYNDWLIITKIK